ncbi:uncharacterized protein isoform X2 [Rhodnius prolixus]|uniref:uncharacterized protein isoform X2 n=1 Tax=Rhodnius prolixus TaxID=13249 RepID=UPI003D188CA2
MLKILILVSAFANLITSYKNPKLLSDLHSGYPKEYSDYKKLHYYLQNVPRKMHYVETRKSYDPSKAVRHKRPDIYFLNRTKNLTSSTNQQAGSQNDYNSSMSSISTTDNGLGTTTACSEFTTVHTETTTPCQETTTAYSGSSCSESTPISSTECSSTNQQTSTVSTKTTCPETSTTCTESTTTIESVSTSTTPSTTTTSSTTPCNPPKSTVQVGDEREKQASIESNQTINVGKVTCPVCHTPILINLEII